MKHQQLSRANGTKRPFLLALIAFSLGFCHYAEAKVQPTPMPMTAISLVRFTDLPPFSSVIVLWNSFAFFASSPAGLAWIPTSS